MEESNKTPTMTDIANRVGVSGATVSLVLNGAPGTRISTETREKVLAAAREIGYQRKQHPKSAHRVIGFLINELTTSQHVATLLEGARNEAAQNDCQLGIFVTEGDPEIEDAALNYLLSRPLIGVVYATLLTQGVNPPDRLQDIPTVLLNCHHAKSLYPSVVPGDVAGGFAATTALLEAGHRRIAIINGEDWIEASRDRVQGYRQALISHDIAVDPGLIYSGGWTQGSGRQQANALLDLPSPPTAIFCYCDRMAVGVYEAIKSRGLRIPGDISVVGFDDESFARDMDPPLTTLSLPHVTMGRWAVARLLDLTQDSSWDRKIRKLKMECPLVVRESIGPPPVECVALR